MKYIVLLGDGMADYPVPELNNKTPLEVANTPTFDKLAQLGEVGLVQTVPAGMAPGSDVANLAVMGFDAKACYTGRSPLEAVSMGIPLDANDVTYRCNLVTLDDAADINDATILDHSSGEITTEEARILVEDLVKHLDWKGAELHAGVSYRHCLVIRDGKTGAILTPPHDVTGKKIKEHLPQGENADLLKDWMQASRAYLENHPINIARKEKGLNPANCCWFWGEGTRPKLERFEERYHLNGGVVSAVDLLKGIGLSAGLLAPDVEGATGTLNTNYQGKIDAALDILEENDFVYIHFEGPDECGHQGNVQEKILSIERLDELALKPLMKALDERNEMYHILLVPDHATPIVKRTHTSDPIPFVIYRKEKEVGPHAEAYDENHAAATGLKVEEGHQLMSMLLK